MSYSYTGFHAFFEWVDPNEMKKRKNSTKKLNNSKVLSSRNGMMALISLWSYHSFNGFCQQHFLYGIVCARGVTATGVKWTIWILMRCHLEINIFVDHQSHCLPTFWILTTIFDAITVAQHLFNSQHTIELSTGTCFEIVNRNFVFLP